MGIVSEGKRSSRAAQLAWKFARFDETIEKTLRVNCLAASWDNGSQPWRPAIG